MNGVLWSCAALLALFVSVESLTCKTCDVDILGECLSSDSVVCTGGQNRCFNGKAEFSSDQLLSVHSRGCIEASQCKNVTKQPILTITYSITMHCCSTDLCNGAAATQTPLLAALAAALVALWSQWGL